METRPFGRTGIRVPVLGSGAMQIGDPRIAESEAASMLNGALDVGLTLIDTARSYGLSEERIGRHLAHRRGEFALSTKVGCGVDGLGDWTYECVMTGVDAARDRLRTDVIDIVHLHSCDLAVLRTGEAARALLRCRELGKIRVAAYSGDDEALRAAGLDLAAADLDGVALRFSAYAPGVDCVIVGGTDARHLQKNIAAVSAGPLRPEQLAAIRSAFNRAATNWRGLI